jgi:hypothetical protein
MNKTFKISLIFLAWILLCLRISVSAETSPIRKAEIKRLPPSVFINLPETIRRALDARGCTIPQPYDNDAFQNVVSGEFVEEDQKDWAVLCSRNGISSILVFWNGSAKKITVLDTYPDNEWFQSIGSGQDGFSRLIMVASKEQILGYHDYAKEFRDVPDLPPLTHDGIDQFFVNKASTVRYYYKGHWLNLSGAD